MTTFSCRLTLPRYIVKPREPKALGVSDGHTAKALALRLLSLKHVCFSISTVAFSATLLPSNCSITKYLGSSQRNFGASFFLTVVYYVFG